MLLEVVAHGLRPAGSGGFVPPEWRPTDMRNQLYTKRLCADLRLCGAMAEILVDMDLRVDMIK